MAKIICVGHQKTGTTSIAKALKNLDYSVGQVKGEQLSTIDWDATDATQQIENLTINILAEHEAIQDTPCAFMHRQLDEAFPGSKFILTRRDTNKWIKSYANFFQDKSNGVRKWMYGVDQFTGNEDIIRRIYEDKNNEIIDYFKDRPDDFLILDLEKGDGWIKLVNFLGDGFLKPFPHENKGGGGWQSRVKRHRRNVITRIFYVITIMVLLVIWAYQ